MSKLRFACLVGAAAVVANTAAFAQAPGCTGKDLLAAMTASQPDDAAALRKAADAVENGKALLWKIEDPQGGARGVSYLYGTLHVTDERVLKPTPAVRDALSSVRRVAVEISDVSAERLAEGLNTMRGAGRLMLPNNDKLSTKLSPNELLATEKVLQRAGLPADVAARVQPWAAMAMLATPDCERSRMASGRLPLDGDIVRRAEDRGIGAVDLETVETQFTMMAEVPADLQLSLLKAQVALAPIQNDITETMIQLFLARDVGAMWPLQVALGKQAGVDPKAYDAYHEHIIVARNKHMGNRLYPHIKSGGVFIAVGAMHLPGPTGLVAQVKEMGFTVTAVE